MGERPRTLTIDDAMSRALELAARGPAHGPNPRVGCVLLGPPTGAPALPDGAAPGSLDPHPRRALAEGYHRGAGTPHAEAAALADARARGVDVAGATAVVTLEPCAHTGRTGPCADALVAAGVAEVVHAVDDPNPAAAGGARRLRAAGVRVVRGLRAAEGEELLRVWLTSVRRGTPYVTLKTATTLDGYVAAEDGTSRWITGPAAREHAHRVRGEVDAIVVGTGTLLTDDPSLTARVRPHGAASAEGLADHQPVRVVVGMRGIPPGARVRGEGGELVHLLTRDVGQVLVRLGEREVRHVLLEGGPTLATAFLAAGAVDELHAYVAPVLLGGGRRAVDGLGVSTIGDAHRFRTVEVRRVGDDALVVSRRFVERQDG
ncbi:bifunctional diaminohydroxyphosphoribosylaminopyrimidine deaminase/5-amino-6-(5-phosphoribosylamino)uracil reductase RibD [Cellulosimicrobium marinum]|uniref:bifunctional diaminohydroxyphosphoribosylaminopyrimidine deaminase/5-amino-6-(5-phosphoribosylamino)uracil reductase RibD n=1 Tax=Cellulosimicrobium marinum TaxID=1638992 RepID=UPI001E3E3673|nr:bifunctional diaminohydroxyphosphoribosylaminopyrimidine deaminase/5-amino-6-(5-phosphoribosylamino)uracil reductase RibD [Cellulosimicrobium marinum]MCB7137550.1 bifunctional diaminohydroxyphosphoribosylaminopyrimidine deaminase/5-amino-6-(5-phosphoribosylamino)uracil reductase RibD [Cellulosimicrobium marinum]